MFFRAFGIASVATAKSPGTGRYSLSPSSPAYEVRIVYRKRGAPKVRVLNPPLDPRAPHRYRNGTLCLYWPKEWRWTDDQRNCLDDRRMDCGVASLLRDLETARRLDGTQLARRARRGAMITRMHGQPSVADLFRAKQDEMEAALTANRRVMPHEGEKGAAAELRWREMLGEYLPNRYSVQSGFVVDHRGTVSRQVDVIIHDAQYSPFLFRAGTSCFVPAESVYAVFDAKQEVNRGTVLATGMNVASVRALDRTSARVSTVTGPSQGKDPNDQPILGGILAVASGWNPPFGTPFRDTLADLDDSQCLDLGVAVQHGAFALPQQRNGPRDTQIYDSSVALAGFLIALTSQLQSLGTALAMDLKVWGRHLPNRKGDSE